MKRRTLLKTLLATVTGLTTAKVAASPEPKVTDNAVEPFRRETGLTDEEYRFVVTKVFQETNRVFKNKEDGIHVLDIDLAMDVSEKASKYGEWMGKYSRTFLRDDYAFEVGYCTFHAPDEQRHIMVYRITKTTRAYHDKWEKLFEATAMKQS